jgi:hypothetical protein
MQTTPMNRVKAFETLTTIFLSFTNNDVHNFIKHKQITIEYYPCLQQQFISLADHTTIWHKQTKIATSQKVSDNCEGSRSIDRHTFIVYPFTVNHFIVKWLYYCFFVNHFINKCKACATWVIYAWFIMGCF